MAKSMALAPQNQTQNQINCRHLHHVLALTPRGRFSQLLLILDQRRYWTPTPYVGSHSERGASLVLQGFRPFLFRASTEMEFFSSSVIATSTSGITENAERQSLFRVLAFASERIIFNFGMARPPSLCWLSYKFLPLWGTI
ncbi:hypothetical protein AVEN_137525-1 [Araneus ventricosus]|uniref:Uncharacterized protein n=1 Tax=Araneus ventricosus TaxID=182803 RepID=A0A4Y2JPB2_ARAVE|nr:hypothetical protein AVEN_137525-1 [Araneus ventricosus]